MSQKTTVDWFRFRTQAEPRETIEAMRPMFGELGQYLHLEPLDRGILGFQQGCEVKIAGNLVVGRCDFGGDSQRGWVRWDIPGKGCEWVKDWAASEALEETAPSEVKRLDIALTTWHGEVTHQTVVDAYQAGRFAGERCGRPPALRQVISSDPRAGRTCYIGSRKADKLLRCYEKGWEMAKSLPEAMRDGLTHVDGCPPGDIYRCELELKAAERPIPWEVIERRDQYFAGSYPFCADILPGIEVDILKQRPERTPQRELAAALAHLRHQWGSTLYTALHAYGGDISAVWEKVCGDQHNRDLLDAGVLLVEHES